MNYVKEPKVNWILSHMYWNNYYWDFNYQDYQSNQTVLSVKSIHYYINESENGKQIPPREELFRESGTYTLSHSNKMEKFIGHPKS